MQIESLDQIESPDRYQSFIVFDPAITRVSEGDVFLKGSVVKTLYNKIDEALIFEEESLQNRIIHNRISKIGQMLSLIKHDDNVLVTKFFDRIWRRYAYISNLGENFLDLPTFLRFFPEYKEMISSVIAQRFDSDELFEDVDDESDDTDTDESENKQDLPVTEA